MGGEVPCPGLTEPTINNTDTIELEGPAAVAPAVYFDLKKGGMSPGTENESPELSEIEIDVEWPDGFFGLGGGNNVDRFKFGESILGPAVMMNNDSDGDAFLGSTQTILLRGEGGRDKLSGKGGPGFLGPIEIFMTIEGGGGADKITGGATRDVLYGEGGEDKVKGGDGKDIIEVKGGGKDKVKCGAGNDEVLADSLRQDRGRLREGGRAPSTAGLSCDGVRPRVHNARRERFLARASTARPSITG